MPDTETEIFQLPSASDRRLAAVTGGQTFAALSMWSGAYPAGGIQEVLGRMAGLTRRGAARPQLQALAMAVTEKLPTDRTGHPDRKNRRAIASAVYDFVVENVAYRHDNHGVEQLQAPLATLQTQGGDCDDMAVLCAALLKSLGVPTRFRVIATNPAAPGAYTHVFCEYQDRAGRWHSCDPVGDPGVDALVAPGRVLNTETHAVSGGGGPQRLAVLSASASAAGQRLAGGELGSAGLGGIPQGPVAGPDAWLQITGRSHSGEVPDQERFALDVRVERDYPLFQPCAIRLVAEHAEGGDELAAVEMTGSKWTSGFASDRCGANASLTFPLGFQPASTPVVLKVYDTDLFSGDDLLGESSALFLTEEEVKEPDDAWEDVRDAAAGAKDLLQSLLTVGVVIGSGYALTASWPYIERVLPDFTEDD